MHLSKFGNGAADQARSMTEVTLPTICPECQSHSISTTARSPDQHTYWRCSNCGEIWNVVRRQSRSSGVSPWR